MSTSETAVNWYPIGSWDYPASEIVNEQALEERAHSSMISDAVYGSWSYGGEIMWYDGAYAMLAEQALEEQV